MALIDNIVRYWKFDENAANTTVDDAVGGTDAASNVNTSVLSTTGKINTSFNFNGTSEYVDSNEQSLNAAEAKSFNFWIRTTTTSNSHIISMYDGTDYYYILCNGRAANALNIESAAGGNFQVYWANAGWRDGNWHMVTWTQGGGSSATMKIYLDSVEKTLTIYGAGTVSANALNADWFIGCRNSNGTPANYFVGDLDEIGIWSKVLTQGEIDELYNAGAGLAYPFPVAAAGNSQMFGANF